MTYPDARVLLISLRRWVLKKRALAILFAALAGLLVAVVGNALAQTDGDGSAGIPRRVIDLPASALARGAPDAIAALSPGLPDHLPGREPGGGGCDKDIDTTSAIAGMTHLAALDTGICDNADIDTYSHGGNEYVVIAGRDEAVWTHIEVTDPANPLIVAQYVWIRSAKDTSTPDIKAFSVGGTPYVVVTTEFTGGNSTCGVFIFDVTDPANADMVSQITESGVWCSAHNAFVETDGTSTFVYITANSSSDLRVYDVTTPATPAKVGTYQRTVRGFFGSGPFDDIYVHDVTVESGQVYVSYWRAGLDILPTASLRGGNVADETAASNISPADFPSLNPFLVHHAYPVAGGRVVVEDEIEINNGSAPVQLFTTVGAFVDGLVQGTDVPVLPAHNLDVNFGIDPNRVYVGWYQGGLQSWAIDPAGGFVRLGGAPRTASIYHQVQLEPQDDPYSSAWGVRTASIGGVTHNFVSDRNFGLLIGCSGVGCASPPPPTTTTTTTTSTTTTTTTSTTTTSTTVAPGASPGLLRVVTSPAVGSQIVVDGVARDTWGLNWLKLPPGSYAVSFTDMEGFSTPSEETATVAEGVTTEVTGVFSQRGLLRVVTSPAVPATISVDGVPRNDWGMWTDLDPGSYEVCFGDVADYTTPVCETVTIAAGDTAVVTGTYVANPGAVGPVGHGMLRVTTSPALPSQILIDGVARDTWGLTWMKLAPGTYEVSFRDVTGFTTPDPQTITVNEGATTEVTGIFTSRGWLRVTTTPPVPATISVDGIPRDDWGMWTDLEAASYQVCFGDVAGFTTPTCQIANITAGTTAQVTGSYN